MAGLTPFQFSSRRTQEKSIGGNLLGINIGGTLGQGLKTAFSWYEMWINPEKVDINTTYIQKKRHTAGSIVTYHYRREPFEMTVSGQCGWVMIQSKSGGESKITINRQGISQNIEQPRSPKELGLASDNSDNSPRLFLKRLKNIADEPMYFVDANGIEHLNVKFIKIFTKQFPEGIICEGYYTRFHVPESADDVQSITYDFAFIVENLVPVSIFEKSLGMWRKGHQIAGFFKGL